jgi:hypothetical protein
MGELSRPRKHARARRAGSEAARHRRASTYAFDVPKPWERLDRATRSRSTCCCRHRSRLAATARTRRRHRVPVVDDAAAGAEGAIEDVPPDSRSLLPDVSDTPSDSDADDSCVEPDSEASESRRAVAEEDLPRFVMVCCGSV